MVKDKSEQTEQDVAYETVASEEVLGHPRLPQYTVDEVKRATDVFRLLIKVRDRCRREGFIDW